MIIDQIALENWRCTFEKVYFLSSNILATNSPCAFCKIHKSSTYYNNDSLSNRRWRNNKNYKINKRKGS